MTVNGYFQEYCAIKWRNAAHIPDGMNLEESSPIFCAGATAYNSVMDTLSELKMDDPSSNWVAVIGTGGLGHLGEFCCT